MTAVIVAGSREHRAIRQDEFDDRVESGSARLIQIEPDFRTSRCLETVNVDIAGIVSTDESVNFKTERSVGVPVEPESRICRSQNGRRRSGHVLRSQLTKKLCIGGVVVELNGTVVGIFRFELDAHVAIVAFRSESQSAPVTWACLKARNNAGHCIDDGSRDQRTVVGIDVEVERIPRRVHGTCQSRQSG